MGARPAAQPRVPRAADEDYDAKALAQLRFPPATTAEITEVQNNLDKLFPPRSFKGATGMTLPYRLHTPDRASYKNKAPLLVFMHGGGERGADNRAQVGPTVFIAGPGVLAIGARAKAMPAFILAPQCPWAPEHWDGTDVTPTDLRFSGSTKALTTTMELLDVVIKENPTIDTRRIYVMGMSMGGFASWEMISRWSEKFAAAIPMCSGGDRSMAAKIVYMPIWAFHSTDDGNVPIEWDRRMIEKLKSLGGSPKFSTYTGPGHIVWGPAYREPALFPWLFSQSQ
ncbi:MAG: prolyl oligopeptidase family serine peptidase [Deltaproteobacteria bacterium]|nr:prolyl oligopeptidase family serine peptidase [Deltaproteobacteria bacterium]